MFSFGFKLRVRPEYKATEWITSSGFEKKLSFNPEAWLYISPPPGDGLCSLSGYSDQEVIFVAVSMAVTSASSFWLEA